MIEKLKGHVPDSVVAEMPEVSAKFGIDTAIEIACFLGQCAPESGDFKKVEESLYYKDPARLVSIFKTAFKNEPDKLAKAKMLVCNPEALGNFVYASIGGYKFRGRGYIQLTGKANYQAFQKAISDDIMANPDLVATKYPLLSAAFYFGQHSLGKCTGVTPDVVRAVTATVNAGLLELDKRIERTQFFYKVLTS